MSSPHSFYLAPEAWTEPYTLSGSEARHALRVLRLKSGDSLRLFDGRGRQGLFHVTAIHKNSLIAHPDHQEWIPPHPVRYTLAAGFSKALRRGWFLEKAVELEASALWFWQGDYSQASLPEQEKEAWKHSLIAGAKQCANPWLPELAMLHGGVDALIRRLPEMRRVFLLYEGDTAGRLLTRRDLAESGDFLLIVGPEGGFSPREADALTASGAVAVSLGGRILRWETAAVLTLGLAWWARQEGQP